MGNYVLRQHSSSCWLWREGNFWKWKGVFFCLQWTEVIQPSDAGYDRSTKCCIGNGSLVNGYVQPGKLRREKWQKLRRGSGNLIWLATRIQRWCPVKWMTYKMDDLRIGCFERTVCLLTRDSDEKLDKKIKRQGVNRFFQSINRRTSFRFNCYRGGSGYICW